MKITDFLFPEKNQESLRIFLFGLQPNKYSIKIALMPLPSRGKDKKLLSDYLIKLSLLGFKKIISLCSKDHKLIKTIFETNPKHKIVPMFIEDFKAPIDEQFFLAFEEIKKSIDLKEDVLIHCFAGYGRSGSILAGISMIGIYYYYKKLPCLILDDLIDTIRLLDEEGNQSVESLEQLNALTNLEQKLINYF